MARACSTDRVVIHRAGASMDSVRPKAMVLLETQRVEATYQWLTERQMTGLVQTARLYRPFFRSPSPSPDRDPGRPAQAMRPLMAYPSQAAPTAAPTLKAPK